MRSSFLLNDDWLFHRGDLPLPPAPDKGVLYSQSKTERRLCGPAAYAYPDTPDPYSPPQTMVRCEKWERVSLPHDYVLPQDNCADENCARGYLHYDNAWYRKHFKLPEGCEDKRILLRFDGVAGACTLYLNGCLLRRNFSSYNTFEIDISELALRDRENVLAVYVCTEEPEGWWYQGGGIYRSVHLTVTEPVAVDLWGVFAPCRQLDAHRWQVDFETTVVNASFAPREVTAESLLLAPDGSCVARASVRQSAAAREKTVFRCRCIVTDPLLWDCEHPTLYTVRTRLFNAASTPIDRVDTRIGFRTIEITAREGLLLNGKRTFIKGVCAHQDFGLTGLAVPDNVARHKIALIREMGANGYRTSHYQQTESYMDALDEKGFLVLDEVRRFENTPEALEQLRSLILRDRNRPSVFCWSVGNEEPFFTTDTGRRLFGAIAAEVRRLDPTRPVTVAEDRQPEESTVFGDCDLIGINYNLESYDAVHAAYPDKPVFSSECCATGTTRDWHFEKNTAGRLADRDVDTNSWFQGREKTWRFLTARPWVFGAFQWAAVEHRGEAIWPRVCSVSGALDLFLQKKGAFYQNQSLWTDTPMAHILPHWNFRGLEGRTLSVVVYTNCDALELFLNGRCLGKQPIDRYGHGLWQVPYAPGRLEVVGYRDGKAVCRDRRETTGRPCALRLTQDLSCTQSGRDLALFTCSCLDEQGREVPDAAEFVRFSVSAPARIVGTGSDHCDHRNPALPERQMYMGKITVAVQPEKGQPSFTLLAQSDACGLCALEVSLPPAPAEAVLPLC